MKKIKLYLRPIGFVLTEMMFLDTLFFLKTNDE